MLVASRLILIHSPVRFTAKGGTLNERLYGLQDANWNMVALCDESGDVQERFNYTAYGVCTALNPDFSAPYSGTDYDWTVLYTSRELDIATGLWYYRGRSLHSELGGFINRDPIESDVNFYRYCGDMPTSRVDPTGMADLITDPPQTAGMPWHYAPGGRDSHTEGGATITCGCVCGRRLFRRGWIVRCRIEGGWTVYLSEAQIRSYVKGELHPSEAVENGNRLFVGVGTPEQRLARVLMGVYGHEQRHVESELSFLRALQKQLTAEENQIPALMRDYAKCAARAERLEASARLAWRTFSLNEPKHANPNSPREGELFAPLGVMPAGIPVPPEQTPVDPFLIRRSSPTPAPQTTP